MRKSYSVQSCRDGEKGVVLLIVLILMVFVAALATDIIKSSRYDYSGAIYLRSVYMSSAILESAAEASRGMFQKEAAEQNGTAFEDLSKNFNSTMVNVSSLIAEGSLRGIMEDEDSRFPLNNMGKNATMPKVLTNVIANLCSAHGYSGDDNREYAENYVNSILCWTGNGTSCGDDDSFYGAEDPAYARPKGPIVSTDELLLIKRPDGWLDDEEFMSVYNGTSSIPGLKDLVTPYSNGPMNINTLPREIITAFISPDWSDEDRSDFYEDVVKARNDSDEDSKWFNSIANSYKAHKKFIPDVGYSSGTARVTIWYNKGIYKSSLTEVFEAGKNSGSIKYKKFGH